MADSSVDAIKQVLDYPAAPLRVLGPPRSGKTRLLIERYRVLREKGLDVRVLTYTKDSYRRLTESILIKNSVQFGDDPVVQYARLAGEVIALSGEKRPALISAVEEQLLLENVIVENWNHLKSSFRSICRTERFIKDVLDVIHTLIQNGIGEKDVSALAEAGRSGYEIDDVLMIFAAYREALKTRNLTTHPGVSWDAARLCKKTNTDHTIARADVLLVEDFQDIDPGQFALLTAIAPPGGSVVVNVFGDPIGSVFGHRGTQVRFLREEFPLRYGGETIHLNARCLDADGEGRALGALLTETLGGDAERYVPLRSGEIDELPAVTQIANSAVEKTLSLEIAGSELDEAHIVAARIENLLLAGQCEAADIAVITNEKSRYAHILRSAFRQHGIALDTGGAGRGVFEDFAHAILLLIDTPDDDVAVRSIVTSPLYGHLRKEVLGNGAASSENDGPDDRRRLREFVTGLSAELRDEGAPGWMTLIVEKCFRPVCVSFYKETNDDAVFTIINTLVEAWAGYAASIDKIGRAPEIRTFVGVCGLFTSQTAAPRHLSGTVGLYSCRESKGLFFPVVFVVGCSDLLFPAVSDRRSLIPVGSLEDVITKTIPDRKISFHTARAAVDVLREQHHFLYIGLSRSTRALHLSAPSNFGGDEHAAPCAVLKQSIAERHRLSTPENDRIPAPVRFARAWTAGGGGPELAGPLAALSPAGAAWRLGKAQGVPIVPERRRLSKSTLQMFLACPRQYYYQKVLGIPQEATATARLGKLLHSVMERLGKQYPTKTALHAAAAGSEIIQQLIDEVIDEDGTVEPSSFLDRSTRHYLDQMINGVLELDASLEDDYKISGVEVNVPFSHGDVDFTGFVDRIEDHGGGTTFIVDFKTGKIAKMGKTHRKYVLNALDDPKKADWQIPFYLWGMKMREGRLPGAFRFMAAAAGEAPRAVTLHACADEDSIPDAARKKSGGESYLLDGEIEQVMDLAAAKAKEMFAPREKFERAVDDEACGWCEFIEVCQREKKWS